MRTELEVIEQIENYLLNKMSPTDKSNFEEQLKSDENLKQQTEFQQNLVEGIKRVGVQTSVQNAYKGWKLKVLLTKVGIGLIIAGFVTATAIFWPEKAEEAPQESVVETVDTFIVDENDSLFATANTYLDQELFEIENDHDTVIETKDGLVVYIPANAFDTDNDKTDIVVQGALTPEDILRSGLSTLTEDGDTLETGGMFYIDAFANGERVGLNKELTVDVPADPSKTGMMLFDGEKDEAGEIVWKDPKELKRPLTPVDILSLDFYPPGYEDWMDKKGYLNKRFKDSLYFSFAFQNWGGGQGPEVLDLEDDQPDNPIRPIPQVKINPKDDTGASTDPGFFPGGNEVGMLLPGEWQPEFPQDALQGDTTSYNTQNCRTKGEALFSANCKSCHFPNKDMTGPSLQGARQRWINNSTEENFYAWIKNSQSVIKSGDAYANSLFNEWNKTVQPAQALTNEEIDLIFCYIEGLPKPKTDFLPNENGVDPASVETIWNEKFNNTNLATKEFEMRMPYIHRTCNTAILELYINNLEMDLSDVDQLAVSMGAGAKFQEFANLNQGSVEMSSESSKALNAYYEKKRKMLAEAVRITNETYWKEQYKLDQEQNQATTDSQERNRLSSESTYAQELEFNTNKVYNDLGMSKPKPRTTNPIQFRVQTDVAISADGDIVEDDRDPAVPSTPIQSRRSTVRSNVGTLGWKNVDCLMSTARRRESVKIAGNGRKTSITYMPWSVSVANHTTYDNINVYNIPKEFNSYVKLQGKDGMYTQNLNMDLHYKTAIVAWNKDGLYYDLQETSPGRTNANLKAVSRAEFDSKVKAQLSSINNMEEEMEYAKLSQSNVVRKNTNKFKLLLRAAVHKIIFPCGSFAQVIDEAISSVPVEMGASNVEFDANGDVANNNNMVQDFVDVEPEFPGGETKMYTWINQNVRYPQGAQDAGEQGIVYVQYIVNTDGSIEGAKVVRGVSSLLNREALRLVKSMPNWKPAQKDGKAVRMRFTLPINFRLQ